MMAEKFTIGQSVCILTGKLGTVEMIDQWPDGHPRYRVRLAGEVYGPGRPAPAYREDELQPVRTAESVRASDAEAVEYLTGTRSVRTPEADVDAAARPFQVGDRVRIIGWDTYGPHEGTITEILPARMRTDGFLAGVPKPAYVVTDCEYTLDSGSTALACAALNEDLTGAGWYGGQIELIEPAESPGVDEHIRSHEPSCGATVHQWDGIDSGELGPCGQPATGTAIGQTGRPFSVCNEHADNTTPERCASQYSGIQCDLPGHDGLHAEGEQDTRDIGEWNTPAGDVIVFRRTDGVLCADVLADSSVKEPAHLRQLAEALNAAATAWEAM